MGFHLRKLYAESSSGSKLFEDGVSFNFLKGKLGLMALSSSRWTVPCTHSSQNEYPLELALPCPALMIPQLREWKLLLTSATFYFLRKECFGAVDIKTRVFLIPNHTNLRDKAKPGLFSLPILLGAGPRGPWGGDPVIPLTAGSTAALRAEFPRAPWFIISTYPFTRKPGKVMLTRSAFRSASWRVRNWI